MAVPAMRGEPETRYRTAVAAVRSMEELFGELIEERRAHPRPDLLSRLVRAETDDRSRSPTTNWSPAAR